MARITKVKQVTDRDMSILTDLGRCRVLSVAQLQKQYWPEAKERTCLERLARLEKAGYIQSLDISAEKPGYHLKVYYLDAKGRKEACGPVGLIKDNVFVHPGKLNEILHQVRTNNVYYTLSANERETYRIGDLIEKERGVSRGGGGVEVPDASYVSDDGNEIFVEADTGQYNSRQVRKKVSSFGDTKTVWVCPENRARFLQRHGARGEFLTYRVAG